MALDRTIVGKIRYGRRLFQEIGITSALHRIFILLLDIDEIFVRTCRRPVISAAEQADKESVRVAASQA